MLKPRKLLLIETILWILHGKIFFIKLNELFSNIYSDNSCGAKFPFICEKLKTGEINTNTFVQPLSFGDGKPCPDGYSTFGGIKSAESCKLRFIFLFYFSYHYWWK